MGQNILEAQPLQPITTLCRTMW